MESTTTATSGSSNKSPGHHSNGNSSLRGQEPDRSQYTPLSSAMLEAESRLRQNAVRNQVHTQENEDRVEGSGVPSGGQAGMAMDEGNTSKLPELSVMESVGAMDETDGMFDERLFGPVLKTNQYQVRKSAARALMDAALMMANISQLRTVIELGPEGAHHYYVLLSLTSISLVMQVVFAVLMFVLLLKESEMAKKKDYLEHLYMLESKGLPKQTADTMKRSVVNSQEDYRHEIYTSRLNYGTMFLVFLITVINMFITGFGIRNKDTN